MNLHIILAMQSAGKGVTKVAWESLLVYSYAKQFWLRGAQTCCWSATERNTLILPLAPERIYWAENEWTCFPDLRPASAPSRTQTYQDMVVKC